MYMPDCVKSLVDIANAEKLNHRVYNVTGMSFSAGELASEIKKHIPEFEIDYKPDFRQAIADSWPRTVDDSLAREEWGWDPAFNLEKMTADMLQKLRDKFSLQ